MLETELERDRRQAVHLLVHLGLHRVSKAVRYLSVILPGITAELPPGQELWTPAAEAFGQRRTNVRSVIHLEIQRAYQRDPVRLSEVNLEDGVLFSPPRSRDFIAMAAKWLCRYQFVDQFEAGRFVGTIIVARLPKENIPAL